MAVLDAGRVIFIFLIFFFLFITPDSHISSPSQQREIVERIRVEREALDILNRSAYGSFEPSQNRWLNISGLRQDEHFDWSLLQIARDRALKQLPSATGSTSRASGKGSPAAEGDAASTAQHNSERLSSDALTSLQAFQVQSSFYRNVTGIVRGQWSRTQAISDTKSLSLNYTAPASSHISPSQAYKRNITGLSGELRIKLEETTGDKVENEPQVSIRDVKAELLIMDQSSSGDGWEIVMFGVHYIQQGGILLSTTSERYAGIFAVPHFALSEEGFALAKQLLNQTLGDKIREQEASFESVFNPWTSSPSGSQEFAVRTAHCEYIVYLQQYSIDEQDVPLDALERELQYPSGAPLHQIPPLKMSAVIYSPDCGFILESKGPPSFSPQEGNHLVGYKLENYLSHTKRIIIAFASLVAVQIFLLKRQMHETSTPSTRSRVSFYTIAIMALGDGFVCMSLMVAGMFIDALFLPLVSTAFLSFICVSFFGMKFLMDVWTVQAPERQERERERRRAHEVTNRTNATSNAGTVSSTRAAAVVPSNDSAEDTLPLPATARRSDNSTATPVILPPDQDLDAAEAQDIANGNPGNTANNTNQNTTMGSARRELGALYSKFYFILLAILFLSLHATTWPLFLRSLYCNILTFTYLSLWTPQIYRNIMRNCRKALRWDFVIGESLLRFAPFCYFYAYDENILFVRTDTVALYILAGWLWIQVWALASQDILGPRFFLPNGWAPPAYDYHPILREGDGSDGGESGALLPLGFTESLSGGTTASAADPASSSLVTGANTSSSPTTTTSPTPRRKDGKRIFDCAICTEDIEVSVVSASISETAATATSPSTADPAIMSTGGSMSAALSTTLFSRRAYMVTPCRHIFHSPCLEGWMRYRLQCPICRETLPPL